MIQKLSRARFASYVLWLAGHGCKVRGSAFRASGNSHDRRIARRRFIRQATAQRRATCRS